MRETERNTTGKNIISGKPVEKRGFPPIPPRPPANQDLRFVINQSIRLGMKIISEIERALKILKQ
ncbi:MAG: hypothetical protein WCK32_02255 [Chlorobiaceae bacterium]